LLQTCLFDNYNQEQIAEKSAPAAVFVTFIYLLKLSIIFADLSTFSQICFGLWIEVEKLSLLCLPRLPVL